MKKCPFCFEDIQDAAIICRFCQRDLPVAAPAPAAPAAASSGRWAPVVALVTLTAVIGLIVAVIMTPNSAPASSRSSAPLETIEQRAQRTYEPLLRKALASDEKCEVTRMFYQGMRKTEDVFYWSAECANGKSTLVQANGTTGKITYLDCGVAALAGVKCFEPLARRPE